MFVEGQAKFRNSYFQLRNWGKFQEEPSIIRRTREKAGEKHSRLKKHHDPKHRGVFENPVLCVQLECWINVERSKR